MNPNDWTIQDYRVDVEAIDVTAPGYDTAGRVAPGGKREILTLVRTNRPATYEPDRLIGAPVEVRPTVDLVSVSPRPIPAKGEPL